MGKYFLQGAVLSVENLIERRVLKFNLDSLKILEHFEIEKKQNGKSR